MRSAHGAGFLYAVGTQLHIRTPDLVIGSSGNAPILFYFLAGQYEYLRRAFTEFLPTSRFISIFRRGPIIDVDYLIDIVVKKEIPLDVERLGKSPCRYFIPVTNSETGEVRYVSNADGADIFELLRAAGAIPFFFGRRVRLFGKMYFDGEVGSTLQNHIDYALAQGAQNILVIDNTPSPTVLGRLFVKLFARLASRGLRHALLTEASPQPTKQAPPGARIVSINRKILPVGVMTRNKKKVLKAFQLGIEDAVVYEAELQSLFL